MALKKYLHITIWIIFFFKGILDLLNFYPSILNQFALILIIGLFIISFKYPVKIPYITIIVLLAITCILSGLIINKISLYHNIIFFRQLILLQFMYFVIIVNEKNIEILKTIKKTILILFALQIPVSIIKYIWVGQGEKYIGTVSIHEGSVAALIPMVAISYLFSKYLFFRNKKDILFIIMFIIFSQIGGKSATIVYIPIIMLCIYLYYIIINKIIIRLFVRNILFMITFVFFIIYLTIRLNPTLTQDEKIGGKFDINYTMSIIMKYNRSRTQFSEMSREQSIVYFTNYILSQKTLIILFGEGAGKLVTTGTISETKPMLYYYGVSYGGRTGIIWIFLQIGLVGTILFLLLIFKMLLLTFKYHPKNYHNLAFFGIWLSIIIDIFTYSSVSTKYFIINGTFLFYFGLFYRDIKFKQNFLKEE